MEMITDHPIISILSAAILIYFLIQETYYTISMLIIIIIVLLSVTVAVTTVLSFSPLANEYTVMVSAGGWISLGLIMYYKGKHDDWRNDDRNM